MDINALLDLIQKKSYYESGGGKPTITQGLNQIASTIGTNADEYQKLKKAKYEADKEKLAMTPLSQLYGVPSADKEAALKAVFDKEQANTLDANQTNQDARAKFLAQYPGRVGTDLTDVGIVPETTVTPQPFSSKREALQNQFGDIPIDLPVGVYKEVATAKALGSGQVTVHYNQAGDTVVLPKGVASPAGYQPLTNVSGMKGADLAVGLAKASKAEAGKNDLGAIAKRAGAVRTAQNEADKATGKITYADVRLPAFINAELPSNQSPSTAAGAASQVQLAVRQGKSLIAKPGSPQQIALASSDLARAVQRSAPQLETLNGASFANNFITQISALTQRITADPTAKDVPKLRKQIFDILDELDKSSNPIIERQLKNVESLYKDKLPENWKEIRDQQLGGGMPDIPFQEGEISLPVKGGIPGKTNSGVGYTVKIKK